MALQFDAFDTAGWPSNQRVQLWNARASSTITQLSVRPTGAAAFNARMKTATIGDVTFVEALSTAVLVNHLSGQDRRSQTSGYLLHLQRSGRSINRQLGREVVLESGDFVLCDAAAPCQLDLSADNAMLVLKIPRSSLQKRMPVADLFLNRRMTGGTGASSLASTMIGKLWDQSQVGLPVGACHNVLDMACDLVAMALLQDDVEPLGRQTSAQMRLLLAIRQHIDTRLADANLTPSKIADHFRISVRYLHKIFAASDSSVSGYILAQRLARCRAALSDPAQVPRTIATIAYDWGFNDSSHFARVFRDAYGELPSGFRRAPGQIANHR